MSPSFPIHPPRRGLRVVHVVHSLGLGGMEKGIAACAARTSDRIEHAVVCLTRSGRAAALFPPGTLVREIGKPPGHSPAAFGRLVAELRRLRPSVVHTRNWGGVDGIVAARLAGIRGVVHGEHGWDVDDLHGSSRRRRVVRRELSRLVCEVTCVSRHIADWLVREVGVRCPVTQIYNGVDTDRFRPGPERDAVRRSWGLAPEALVVGHVGRLVAVKDHATLLRAFEEVRRRVPRAVLVCAGDGPLEPELRRRAGDGVRLLGHRDDVAEVLRGFDVFALPSLNEGISNTILEAMATGLPVVASRVGGNPELVDDGRTGALVPPGDAAALAAALGHYLAADDLRREHGRTALAAARERFGTDAMARGYERVWERAAAR